MNNELKELLKNTVTPTEKLSVISIYYDGKKQEILNDIEKGRVISFDSAKTIITSHYLNFWKIFKGIPNMYTIHTSRYNKDILELSDACHDIHTELHDIYSSELQKEIDKLL